jgi:uncharacterized protein (AIM24 family)
MFMIYLVTVYVQFLRALAMNITPKFEESLEVIQSVTSKSGFSVEIVAYKQLRGAAELETASSLYHAQQSGLKLKHVRIKLNNGTATIESGALYFMKGNIKIEAKAGGSGGLSGLAKGIAGKLLANETVFRPQYIGTGEIYLEPTFSHFIVVELGEKQALIAEKGMYFCSEGSVAVSVELNKNISAGAFGGEGWFQTKVIGPGLCVLASPVPANEILCYSLNNETLQVDGSFALMRTDGIQFSVQKSTKSILGSMASGEGLLQTFQGTGQVWIAPTQNIYSHLAHLGRFSHLNDHSGSSHTGTSSSVR